MGVKLLQIGVKMAMTSQFSEMTPSSDFFDVVLFLFSSSVHVNIITGSGVMIIFFLWKIDPKSGNQKYLILSFAQYLETAASKGYQIWHECL